MAMPASPVDLLATRSLLLRLFGFTDWSFAHLCSLAAPLSPEQLDTPVPMGLGSLRATINHLVFAEHVWQQRYLSTPPPPRPVYVQPPNPMTLAAEYCGLATPRTIWLEQADDATLAGTIVYHRGDTRLESRLIDILLHVNTHAMHHRAQAINMLRQLGVHYGPSDFIAFARGTIGPS